MKLELKKSEQLEKEAQKNSQQFDLTENKNIEKPLMKAQPIKKKKKKKKPTTTVTVPAKPIAPMAFIPMPSVNLYEKKIHKPIRYSN